MPINSHTKFQLCNSITSWDMESSICHRLNIGPQKCFLGVFSTRSVFFGVVWVSGYFWLNLTKSGFLRHCSFSPHSWLVTFYYQFADDTKFHGTETAVVTIFILLLFHLQMAHARLCVCLFVYVCWVYWWAVPKLRNRSRCRLGADSRGCKEPRNRRKRTIILEFVRTIEKHAVVFAANNSFNP